MSLHTHREIEELLGAYALDALEEDERVLVDAHLVGCPRCRNEVTAHRETIVLLANTGADAPEGVWNRISEALDEAPPELDLGRILPFDPSLPDEPERPARVARLTRRSVSVRATAAMVAVAAGLFAFLGLRVGDDEVGGPDGGYSLNEAFAAASSDPHAEKVSLQTTDGEQGAQVVRLPDGAGFIAAHTLESLPSDRTYQLWGLRGEEAISLGVLGNDPGAASFTVVGPLDGFAITNEAAPGVDVSANKPIAAGFFTTS